MATKLLRKKNGIAKITKASDNMLHHFAFYNTAQASIISIVSTGKIITANKAACKLLGYSTKELLTKSPKDIFDIKNSSFKRILKQRTVDGQSEGEVRIIKKSGALIPCQITSAVFVENGIKKSIITITDISSGILKQKNIDVKKEKIVKDNIVRAKFIQKNIDIKKGKIVTNNIVRAKLRQKNIDIKNAKIVADNLLLAIAKQIKIDVKNAKLVNDNIAVAISRQKKMDVKNAKIVADNIFIAISKQIQIDNNNKRMVADNIASAIAIQKDIDIKNAKIVADNIALAIAKQKDIDIKNAKIVANNIALAISRQKKIDVKNAKIVADNILIAISKQKEIDNNNKRIVADNIALAISKQKDIDINNARIVADNIVLAIAKQIEIDATYKKMVANDIALALTKSNEERRNYEISARTMLTESDKKFKLIFNSSSDVLYDNDLLSGIVIISDAYEREFGHKIKNNMTPLADWIDHIHPDDKEMAYKDYLHMLASKDLTWKYSYRFLKEDGSAVNVISSAIVLRNADGKALRVIGSMRDRDKEKRLEEKLEQEIKLKEKQIEEAIMEAKEAERSEIGKELHDNVNQLLGVSTLYLEMAKEGGEDSEMYLSHSSKYTLQAIEEIRKLSKGLTTDLIKNLGLCKAISNIAKDTMVAYPIKVVCKIEDFIEHSNNDKFKLNIFRIVQEQLNNIIKHAKAREVTISLSQNKKSIIFSISDNGVGFDINKQCKGIGLDNIKSRALNFHGKADFVSQIGKGCVLLITFPLLILSNS